MTAVDKTDVVTTAADTETPWGGLKVQTTGASLEDADQIVVLLHGYGTNEFDLLSLAERIGGESRGFVLPAAPVEIESGRRSWATTEDELVDVRAKLASLVRYVSQVYPDAEIAIGGFSQGASVASLFLTEPELPIRHLILYSPARVVDSDSIDPPPNLRVLLTHGKNDDVLAFDESEKLHELVLSQGIPIRWVPFDGGHSIPPEAVDATREQLSKESTD